MRTDKRTQESLGVSSLPEADTTDARYPDGDARQAADDRPALHPRGVPWGERVGQVGSRADLAAEAMQGSGDA